MAIKKVEALIKNPNQKNLGYPRIVQCFLNADLRGGHNWLKSIGMKFNLDLEKLNNNQFVVFINRRQTMMKCYVAGNTVAFTKRDRIDLNAIQSLPEAFGYADGLDYDKALEISLRERLEGKNEAKSKLRKTNNLSNNKAESSYSGASA